MALFPKPPPAPAKPPPAPNQPEPQVDDYRPTSGRRRLLIALLAVATATTLIWMMLERVGAPPVQRVLPEDRPRCAEGQTQACVGGRAEVLVVPVPASSSPR
jgi:hypothetical protein